MTSIEKICPNCKHYKTMICPNSEKCYSTTEKRYWTMKKDIEIEYKPTLIECLVKFIKTIKLTKNK